MSELDCGESRCAVELVNMYFLVKNQAKKRIKVTIVDRLSPRNYGSFVVKTTRLAGKALENRGFLDTAAGTSMPTTSGWKVLRYIPICRYMCTYRYVCLLGHAL